MNIRELQKALEETIFVGQSHSLGIFKELCNRNDTADGLAGRLGLNEKYTWILLEALAEMGYLKKAGNRYSVPDEVYERLVDEKGQEYEGDFWQFLLYLVNPWRSLEYVLKNGMPDKTTYRDFSMKYFIRGMDSPWKKKIAPEIADICLKHCGHAKTLIDVGGAPGTIAREFAKRNIRAIVYDLPDAIDVTRDELSQIKNIELVSGDATKSIPDGNYDIAFLGNLCHGQSHDDNANIIRMCHERLNENGIIVIFDNLRGESYLGATLALHMITQSPHGDIYSRDEYLNWMKTSGFRNLQVEKISDPAWQLVIGHV